MLFKKYRYDGSRTFEIDKCSTDETDLCADRKEAEKKMEENNARIDELQEKLYAEKKEGVIFLFQAMDAAGKDGTIRAVLTCLSPHGVYEAAFKAPSSDELALLRESGFGTAEILWLSNMQIGVWGMK